MSLTDIGNFFGGTSDVGGITGGSSSGGSGINLGSIGNGLGSLFTAEGDLAQAAGSEAAAQAYTSAAAIAGQDVNLEAESTNLQQIAAARKVRETIARGQSNISGAGLQAGSGSGLAILRESQAQGNVTGQVIGLQGQINENAYLEQETAFTGEAAQATATANAEKSAAAGSAISGIAGLAGALFKLF